MEQSNERVSRDYLSSTNVGRLYPACVVRIARGELTYAEQARINGQASRMDSQWRGGDFNGLQYFHFRFPEQSATMAGFLLRQRLHRLLPGSSQAATPGEVEAEWQRMAAERDVILAWARSTKMLIEIVQTYRFERRQGAFSHAAHCAAAKVVEQADRSIGDPMTYAGVCIEWAEREYRQWFWRCAPNHQVL
jgi:hypothetical protein